MKRLAFILALLLFAVSTHAHTIDFDVDQASKGKVFLNYIIIGFEHILPYGLDHILFILCVFFLNSNIKQVILQASMFTLAHTITLGLAVYGVIDPPASIVEPLIAVSILLLALENMFFKTMRPRRMVMVFVFGLIHGMGFAGALSELGMPQHSFLTALVGFNIGVETGQVAIILCMHFFVARFFSEKPWYRRRIVLPSSVLIALVAGYWTIERTIL